MDRPGDARGAKKPYADVALALLLLAIVGLMIVPVPAALLDLLIASNLAISVVMLLVAMAIPDGLAFAAMPTVLLVTTLYRLALNVSSTRLILLQADAGHVIRAFGESVVRGDYAVGAVVFFILTLVQYVVVARGAERVAEVSARFTLDAMPGKQMAIDADLRAGALSPDGARARRRALERESQFYGAMDGAMKFVKGDAIAGIVITLINLVAGVAIGSGMRGLPVLEALRTYGLLTIGDGLVCQIPSLLVSTSAGLVVTRVAAAQDGASLAGDVSAQLLGQPRALWMAGGFLCALGLMPGLPALPFVAVGAALGASGYGVQRARRGQALPLERGAAAMTDAPGAEASALAIELGGELAARLSADSGAVLERALSDVRAALWRDLGLRLPAARVRAREDLAPRAYCVALHEVMLSHADVAPGEADVARAFTAQLSALLHAHAAELLGLQDAQRLVDELAERAPALVHNVLPKPVALRLLCDVLRRLLREGVSIRPLGRILEALAGEAAAASDADVLVERVRVQLRRHVSFAHATGGVLAVHPVDAMIEDALRDALTPRGLALPPDQARDIVQAVRRAANLVNGAAGSARPVLVTQPDVRRHLRQLLEAELPAVAVLSYAELAPELRVERRAPVRIGAAVTAGAQAQPS
jgi:type III secretion protein V